MNKKSIDGISLQTLKRFPIYLHYLEKKKEDGVENISTPVIANALGYSEILVKKDLLMILNEKGKPKVGHKIDNLINDLKSFLGYNSSTIAALVGVGQLGKALLGYQKFKNYNVEIAVAFDNNPALIGTEINKIKIIDVDKLEEICSRLQIHIGIITVNDDSAQDVCNRLIQAGIKAIWNFAPVNLTVPEGVIIQNENLASSLAILSKKLQKNI